MVETALHALAEVDLAFFLIEATEAPGPGDRFVLDRLKEGRAPAFLVINKVDLVRKSRQVHLVDDEERRRSEEHTSELQSLAYLVCRLLLEKKKEEIGLVVYADPAVPRGGRAQ